MGYIDWFEKHAKKHQDIMNRLKDLSDDEVIEYFSWENMCKKEIDFCPLYKDKKKCHDMDELNCYLCACPNFRFDDNAQKIKSRCSINSKDGVQKDYSGVVHQDCSACTIPHHKKYIKEIFSRDWKKIMSKVAPK
jgi:Zn-finger protein